MSEGRGLNLLISGCRDRCNSHSLLVHFRDPLKTSLSIVLN